MRQRLLAFLPIFIFAITVQIFTPIAASWAAAVVASDPLQSNEICHSISDGASGQTDESRSPAHDGACLICCAVQASASLDTPQQAVLRLPYRQTTRVVWHFASANISSARTGSNARARAPPSAS